MFLAGGLRPETVGACIRLHAPFAVDVSSGIESAPGVKDRQRMAAFVAAVTTSVSIVTVLVFVLVAVTGWVLWRTRFGLRLRSCGENPYAAESLGVNVRLYKYIAVLIAGGLAGLGGGFLARLSVALLSERLSLHSLTTVMATHMVRDHIMVATPMAGPTRTSMAS